MLVDFIKGMKNGHPTQGFKNGELRMVMCCRQSGERSKNVLFSFVWVASVFLGVGFLKISSPWHL